VVRSFSQKLNGRGFLTVAEVSEMLGLSRAMVYRMCKGGVIPTMKFLNSVRVPSDLLRVALERHLYQPSLRGEPAGFPWRPS
jgi:excisionase family DNA binding protein